LLLIATSAGAAQSLTYSRGQNVSPAYEGWEIGADGQKYFVFGYMNRNWEEEIDVPIGRRTVSTSAARIRVSQHISCRAGIDSCSGCRSPRDFRIPTNSSGP
jgi:hypothetical protein